MSETVTVYHGTTDKYLPSIKRYGLIPNKSKGSDAWAALHTLDVANKSAKRPRSVYVSKAPDFAAQFANYSAEVNGGKPVLLELKVPKRAWASFKPDEFSDESDGIQLNWRREKALPARWLAAVKPAKLNAIQELNQRMGRI
jgi:hypothetical protein